VRTLAPRLGEHTTEVLGEIGLSASDLEAPAGEPEPRAAAARTAGEG
jgi:hypothetical protein